MFFINISVQIGELMSTIHAIASVIHPGLGQLIGGKPKEGIKQGATHLALPVVAGAGSLIASIGTDSYMSSKVLGSAVTENAPKLIKAIQKHPKIAVAIGAVTMATSIIGMAVNHIKSIVDAAKIEKK